jgi:DNA-binding response OmpR family regulator
MQRVFLIEDDPILGQALSIQLEGHGFEVHWVKTKKEALGSKGWSSAELVLLDLTLPDGHGFEILKVLRDENRVIPVVILTARTEEESVIQGLKLGANDYLKKPYSQRELLARISSHLAYSQVIASPRKRIVLKNLSVDLEGRICAYNGQEVSLNRKEFDLFTVLLRKVGCVITREELLNQIAPEADIYDRTIDSHISHLRRKLRNANVKDIRIVSEYGIGYRCEEVKE